MKSGKAYRIVIGGFCLLGLLFVFLFQKTDIATLIGVQNSLSVFIVNRTIRFVLNDVLAIGVIYALFPQRKFVLFAIWVQFAGLVFFLLPYFILKIYFPNYNGPMISYLHRLILNPTLLLLLIPAFYYQRSVG